MPALTPLRGMWETTLHVSGIRLRNARGWLEQGNPLVAAGSKPAPAI